MSLERRFGEHAGGMGKVDVLGCRRTGGDGETIRRRLVGAFGIGVGGRCHDRRRRGGAGWLRRRRRERGRGEGGGDGGRPREFEAIDAEPRVERSGVGPDESVVVPPQAIGTSGGHRDGRRRGGRRRVGGLRRDGSRDQTEPGGEPRPDARSSAAGSASPRAAGASGSVASLARRAGSTGLKGVLDHDEPISVGHDPSDVVPSGTELNERHVRGVA